MRVTFSTLAALPAALAWQSWGSSSSNGYWGSNNKSSYSTTSSNQSCDALTIDQINTMGNNSLFTRWRPRSHVLAPAGWMNDPCGAMYDPIRDLYYISYQWHPQHINWGNISWGQATSKDLIHWTDHRSWENSSALTFGPTGYGSYNGLGIFSGTAQPVNLQGESDGTLLVFYTSVSRLPTNWALPYLPGTETQSLAYSTDGGLTYKEYEGNPVIKTTTEQPPMNWNITGFRDPFLEPSPELDAVLGVSEPHYYGMFLT
jgi:beta-fructofuranosidase